MSTPTTPIPAPRQQVAPPKFLECPRCGAVTFTRQGVQKHDAEHEAQTRRERRLDALIERLEGFLATIETVDEHGQRQTLAAWLEATDETLDALHADVERLKEAEPIEASGFVLEAGEWPTQPTADPADERAGEPEPDLDVAPQPTAISAHLAARDPLDDDPYAVDLPGSRF